MNRQTTRYQHQTSQSNGFSIKHYLPFMDWLVNYNRKHLTGDVTAGVIVAIMLVPQSMAYALLAGLPPQIGLYASIVPLALYGLLGTSRALSVGPVAMMSLLVASALGQLEISSVAQYVQLATVLALLVGMIQLVMGVFRIGFLVNFLSHPVLSGFTSAVSIVIGLSQVKHLLGVSIPRTESTPELILFLVENLPEANTTVLMLSTVAILMLLYFKFGLRRHLSRTKLSETMIASLTKLGPLAVVILGIGVVSVTGFDTSANVSVVGSIPAGLPPLGLPVLNGTIISDLLPFAVTIAIIGYLESISVAKALASRRRQKIDANQELVALGIANLGASLSGAYPVAGGVSRSMVNFTSGANTGLASIISATLIALTLLILTPIFYYLPNAVLAAIIMVAVITLFDWQTAVHTWHYSKADFVSLVVTFVGVLIVGVENGILIGATTSLGLYLWRTSRPHVAVVGQIGDTRHYRNVLRHETITHPKILAMRVDESLYFPNAQYLEEVILNTLADNPDVEYFVLICSAVNFIDASALDILESLYHALDTINVGMYCAEVKGPVMDRLQKIGFVEEMGEHHFFLSTHEAMEYLKAK